MGCPIRKSPDQSSFAAPRRLSQRITSFIASCRQGIHQMPLRRLITLIIDVHSMFDHQPATRPTSANRSSILRPVSRGSFNDPRGQVRNHRFRNAWGTTPRPKEPSLQRCQEQASSTWTQQTLLFFRMIKGTAQSRSTIE